MHSWRTLRMLLRHHLLTCDLTSQIAQGAKAFGALCHSHCSSGIHDVEGVAQLQKVVILQHEHELPGQSWLLYANVKPV